MKKISILFAAVAVAFGFVGCTKAETADYSEGVKNNFSLFASITKTSNDGVMTNWVADDAISVFHAEAGTTTYGSNDKFTISESGLASGQFTGTLSEELADLNDWFAVYPYKSGVTDPTGAGSSYNFFNIGCSNSYKYPQKQSGNSSMAHLAGQYYPLCAVSRDVDPSETVSLSFHPVVGVVKFHVTNNSGAPLTINTVALTAEQENIVGSYYIDFSSESPILTPSDGYVSKKDSLTVSGGTAIAVGDSADFYMAIKPFSNVEGNKLTFSVNGYGKSSTAAQSFKAGYIKTVNFNYDKKAKVLEEGTYVALVPNTGTSYYALSSTDNGASTKRFNSIDVKYEGGATFETTDASIVWNVTKEESGYLFENGGKYISWTSGNSAVMSDDPHYLNVVENGDYFKVITSKDSTRVLAKNSSAAFFAFYTGSGLGQFTFVPATFKNIPAISPIANPDKFAAAGTTEAEVSYTITNPVVGQSVEAVSAESWVNSFNYDTEGKIIFTVNENTAAEERSSVVTVSYDGAEDVTFTVTQSAAGGVLVKTFSIKASEVATASTYAAYSKTVSSRDYVITFGGNTKSIGTNKNNRSKCNLSSYSKYAVSPVTTSSVASAFACGTKLTNVTKVSYTYSGGSNDTSTNVYLIYSSDDTTYSQMTLTKGSQGGAILSGTSFEFAKSNGYFAVLFEATNSGSVNWRIDNVEITFTYEQ